MTEAYKTFHKEVMNLYACTYIKWSKFNFSYLLLLKMKHIFSVIHKIFKGENSSSSADTNHNIRIQVYATFHSPILILIDIIMCSLLTNRNKI
jgi:hypothetical protein